MPCLGPHTLAILRFYACFSTRTITNEQEITKRIDELDKNMHRNGVILITNLSIRDPHYREFSSRIFGKNLAFQFAFTEKFMTLIKMDR